MEAQVVSIDGKETKKVELDDSVFAIKASEASVYYAVNNELANARVGTAKTKGRSEVNGSHRKPWRQKGTGRARAGTFQSPVRVGGGVAFGPLPRDYRYAMPRKAKRLAFRSILSMRLNEGAVTVVEDFNVDSGKTKDMASLMKAVIEPDRVVLIYSRPDEMMRRASGNISWLRCLAYNRLNVHDLYYAKSIVLTESAATALGVMLGVAVKEAENAE